jgi:hypothetical protein
VLDIIYALKLKLTHYTLRRRLGERRYSSYSFSTSALDGGEWSASRPGRALAPEKGPPVPIIQEAGWAPEPVWTQRLEKQYFSLCRRSNPDRPVKPVARHYTNCATWLKLFTHCLLCLKTVTRRIRVHRTQGNEGGERILYCT